jgi:hypothetical protein
MTEPPSPLRMLLSRHTKRRQFITLLGGAAAAWPLTAHAQQPVRMREIAIWMGRPNDAEGRRHAAAFRETLQSFGWLVGRNIRTDYRWVTGDIDRGRMAKEIVEQQPDVIVVETTVGVEALARESHYPDSLCQCFRSNRERFCYEPRASRWEYHRLHIE